MHVRIREIREKLGLTRHEFATKIKIKEELLKSVELKRQKIPAEVIAKIVRNYPQVNARWLLIGNGNMFVESEQYKVSDEVENYVSNNTGQKYLVDFITKEVAKWDDEHKIWLDIQIEHSIPEYHQYKKKVNQCD